MSFNKFVLFVNKTLKKKLDPDKNIFQQDVDSIDFTTLLLSLEEKFKIKFKSSSYGSLTSLRKIYAYIQKK